MDAFKNRGAPYHTPDRRRRHVVRGLCMGCDCAFSASTAHGWQSQAVGGRVVELCAECVADGTLRDLQMSGVAL